MSNEGFIVINSLSPTLAEILMDGIENCLHKYEYALITNFVYWCKYVDGIIACFIELTDN